VLRTKEIDLPKRSRRSDIGVKREDAVVFRRDEDDIVLAFARDFELGQIEWLGVNVSVNGKGE
jgi:hypothetical protein